jgi:GNAT superfamily N-acetyltransferase
VAAGPEASPGPAAVEFLSPGAPLDGLLEMVNAAFAWGEEGMWRPGAYRLSADGLRALADRGELVVARRDGALVGCMRLQRFDATAAELGLLTAARGAVGVGRALVAFAEAWARDRELGTMRLQLLVPRGTSHPFKVRLHDWYTRLGYRETERRDFAVVVPEAAPELATPCDLVYYEKAL